MFKLTPAQAALLHFGESVLASAIISFLVGLFQQMTTSHVDMPTLWKLFGAGLGTSLLLVYKSIKADPNLPQAESDTQNELMQFIETRFTTLETRLAGFLHMHAVTGSSSTTVNVPPVSQPVASVVTDTPRQPAPILETIPNLAAVKPPAA